MTGGGPDGVRPPRVDDLLAIPEGAWRELLVHVRRVLKGLPDPHVTPAVQRVRALPANRLRKGRARQDLARLLADGGEPWRRLHHRLAAAEVDQELAWLVAGERPEGSAGPTPSGHDGPDLEEVRADLARARDRARQLRDERDEARRRLAGATAARARAEQEAAQLRQQLEEAGERAEALQAEVDDAAADRDRAVGRERRRQDATIAALQDELTALRREEQERRLAAQEQERAREAAAAATAAREERQREQERVRRAGARDRAAPGRPSEPPPGVEPGTTAFAKALLGPGRRVLVDGYNVAKTVRGDLPDEEAQRAWLEQALLDLAARLGVLPEVFWDGDQATGGSHRRGALAITFSPRDLEADDDVEFAVAASPDDEPLVVVTDDQGLRGRIRPYRVDVLGAQPFSWALRG